MSNQPAMNSGEYENSLIELPSWSKIALAFQEQFDAASSARRFKVHFDCSATEEISVDGVSAKWTNTLLMDAMICLFKNQHISGRQRCFNQHSVLLQCFQQQWRQLDHAGLTHKRCGKERSISVLGGIESPWTSFEEWKTCERDTFISRKSWKKVEKIFSVLDQPDIAALTLPELLNTVTLQLWQCMAIRNSSFDGELGSDWIATMSSTSATHAADRQSLHHSKYRRMSAGIKEEANLDSERDDSRGEQHSYLQNNSNSASSRDDLSFRAPVPMGPAANSSVDEMDPHTSISVRRDRSSPRTHSAGSSSSAGEGQGLHRFRHRHPLKSARDMPPISVSGSQTSAVDAEFLAANAHSAEVQVAFISAKIETIESRMDRMEAALTYIMDSISNHINSSKEGETTRDT